MPEVAPAPPRVNSLDALRNLLGEERFSEMVDDILSSYCRTSEPFVLSGDEDGPTVYVFDHDNDDLGRYGDREGVMNALSEAIERSGDWPLESYFSKRTSSEVLQEVELAYNDLTGADFAEIDDRDWLVGAVVSDVAKELSGVADIGGISPFEWDDLIADRVIVDLGTSEIVRSTVLAVDIAIAGNGEHGDFDMTVGALRGLMDHGLDSYDEDDFEHSSLALLCAQQELTLADALCSQDGAGFGAQVREAVGELLGNDLGDYARPMLLASVDFTTYAQIACREVEGIEVDPRAAARTSSYGVCIAIYDVTEGSGELIVDADCSRPFTFPVENIESIVPDGLPLLGGHQDIRDAFGIVRSMWDAPCMTLDEPVGPLSVEIDEASELAASVMYAYDVAMNGVPEPMRGQDMSMEQEERESAPFEQVAKRCKEASEHSAHRAVGEGERHAPSVGTDDRAQRDEGR